MVAIRGNTYQSLNSKKGKAITITVTLSRDTAYNF